jgi:hypothetical protein
VHIVGPDHLRSSRPPGVREARTIVPDAMSAAATIISMARWFNWTRYYTANITSYPKLGNLGEVGVKAAKFWHESGTIWQP